MIRVLVFTALVDSTRVELLGNARAIEVSTHHDRAARDILARFAGLEVDKSDGFFLLFERPVDAVGYALAYHQALARLSRELEVELEARVGIHLGEVFLRRNAPGDVARGDVEDSFPFMRWSYHGEAPPTSFARTARHLAILGVVLLWATAATAQTSTTNSAEVFIGEVGQVTHFNHIPQTVTLSRSYSNPVVIAQPPSENGDNPAVVRITDVTSSSFTFYAHEPPNMDGFHMWETVSYLVVEGRQLEARRRH